MLSRMFHQTADSKQYLFKFNILMTEQLIEHHVNNPSSSECHQLTKALFPTDHQQSAPEETNQTNRIRNNPCGFPCGLISLHSNMTA
jgi:hypothetical protein